MAGDDLGNRMKTNYEDRSRILLPRRTYAIVRVDGKAFHTFARHAAKPFDYDLMAAMDAGALALCAEMGGARCAYGQSDEYSFLLTDLETNGTQAWFDGNLQKIVSVAASVFGAAFNHRIAEFVWADKSNPTPWRSTAAFEARAFTIPDRIEVENYFIWRQQDAIRNAIQMAGYAQFSPKQLHQVNTSEIVEMLWQQRKIEFEADYPVRARRGRVIWKETYQHPAEGAIPACARSRWSVDAEPPKFTDARTYLIGRMGIPFREGDARVG